MQKKINGGGLKMMWAVPQKQNYFGFMKFFICNTSKQEKNSNFLKMCFYYLGRNKEQGKNLILYICKSCGHNRNW